MSLKLSTLKIVESRKELTAIPAGKVLINTINAHSYNVAQKDDTFAQALKNGDYLIPDGASIVKACNWLNATSKPKERIAGWDLFKFEMTRQNNCGITTAEDGTPKRPKVMFMGSSPMVLSRIVDEASCIFKNLEIITYSPPYKPVFTDEDNRAIINAINDADPDLLWIGMTAPKQEKWAYTNWHYLNIHCHVGTIGAVFDFFAGTIERAPEWWQKHSLEWLYRLLSEPRRMWRRYILGNPLFIYNIIKDKLGIIKD